MGLFISFTLNVFGKQPNTLTSNITLTNKHCFTIRPIKPLQYLYVWLFCKVSENAQVSQDSSSSFALNITFTLLTGSL